MQPEEFQKIYNVPHEAFLKLEMYHAQLLKWQKAINLVSPQTLHSAWHRHFSDSAQLLDRIGPEIVTVADLGSGAGFPGMVLAILKPEIKTHLIESDQRKCEFLRNVSRETKTPVTIHNNRIEEVLADIDPDMITARALAPLKVILDYTDILQNDRLELLLLKGKGAAEEVRMAREFYAFDVEYKASHTDKDAHILSLRRVRKHP